MTAAIEPEDIRARREADQVFADVIAAAPYSDKHARSAAVVAQASSLKPRAFPVGAVLITGAANAGKSTLAAELARVTGWRYVELSELIRARAADVLSNLNPTIKFGDWLLRFAADPQRYRPLLTAFADSHRDAQADYWINKALGLGGRIICGVRRREEFLARRRRRFPDVWIKIERPDWVPPADPSYELQDIETRCADAIVISNTGVEELRARARELAKELTESFAQRR